jgi:hypothetical protein
MSMSEGPPGTYTARYLVPENINVGRTPVFGHLTVGSAAAVPVAASTPVAISNTPPQIVEIAPTNGQTINNDRPSIYATFASPNDVGISADSVTIGVNGTDVTPIATRSDQFVTYSPGTPLPDGNVTVVVRVSDAAGNEQTRTWSFVIHAH